MCANSVDVVALLMWRVDYLVTRKTHKFYLFMVDK
jgi:hypothetical protein